jgi:hypothetical protein
MMMNEHSHLHLLLHLHFLLEWWKVKHPVEPPAQPPIIWSDDDNDTNPGPTEQANSVAGAEPRTFKHAMQGPQSTYWREAASLEYNILVENGTWECCNKGRS